MPTYTEDFEGCRIVTVTEPFDGPVIKGQHRLVSVTVTRDGKDSQALPGLRTNAKTRRRWSNKLLQMQGRSSGTVVRDRGGGRSNQTLRANDAR